MQIDKFDYYRNIYSESHYTQIREEGSWTGYHCKIVPYGNRCMALIGTPYRGTMKLVGVFDRISQAKKILRDELILAYLESQ